MRSHKTTAGTRGFTNPLVSPGATNSTPPPALNWNRIDDFGYLAHHLMAVESKVVIDDYYGTGARYSFWNGCSTGGRQGLSEAQRYPADFNGILAGAPALNWDQFMVAQMWPQLVMEWNHDFLPTCKENLVNTTLQAHCQDQDGQVDGVFDPRNCNVLGVLRGLIGTSTPCGTFTATDALVVQEIWQGPRLSGTQRDLLHGLPVWFGLEPGANLAGAYVPPGARRRARPRDHVPAEPAQRTVARRAVHPERRGQRPERCSRDERDALNRSFTVAGALAPACPRHARRLPFLVGGSRRALSCTLSGRKTKTAPGPERIGGERNSAATVGLRPVRPPRRRRRTADEDLLTAGRRMGAHGNEH